MNPNPASPAFSGRTSPPNATEKKIVPVLSRVICFLTFCLLFVGAMVTSTRSGLSVPDWPTTFGHNMFAYPLSQMRGGVVYEHSHRLFASSVGMLTILLVIATFLWEPRRWVRGIAIAAFCLVCLQGVLGGLTVLFKLPVAVASAHAGVGELFFCFTIWLSWATSASWKKAPAWRWTRLSYAAAIVTVLAFVQILVGAFMRHSYSGLAIPTFPRAYGDWIPPFWTPGIVLNFLHTRIGALLVTLGCLHLVGSMLRRGFGIKSALFLFLVLILQITLGILTVLSGKVPWVASLHLAMGALLLGTVFTILLWSGKQTVVAKPS